MLCTVMVLFRVNKKRMLRGCNMREKKNLLRMKLNKKQNVFCAMYFYSSRQNIG